MRILTDPEVYLMGRQVLDAEEAARFLADNATSWPNEELNGDYGTDPEMLVEMAGRVCYMSFGDKAGRKTNAEYINNILSSAHGSVAEHAVWSLLITGVSRSFTHELIRHRAGWGYSQLSQRYVDESTADFVEPDIIRADPVAHNTWMDSVRQSHDAYVRLVSRLNDLIQDTPNLSKTEKRKMARQAARSVLPNSTETKIFVTANARALRHFIELRGSLAAEPEIRKVAIKVLGIMREEAPNLFKDFVVATDVVHGTYVEAGFHKV